MLDFRKKIFISFIFIFIVILLLLFPLSSTLVRGIVRNALNKKIHSLVYQAKRSSNESSMIKKLGQEQDFTFYRITLLNAQGEILFDSHPKEGVNHLYLSHPEIQKALAKETGYYEGYSYLFAQNFAYIAQAYTFQGENYIIRIAFPLEQVYTLQRDFKIAAVTLGITILAIFSLITWIIINYLLAPIRSIIKAIRPFQEGSQDYIEPITLNQKNSTKEFEQLAYTLNSLSNRIQNQISTLTQERNETRAVLNSLIEGIIAVDEKMVITFANRIALNMLDLKEKNIISTPFQDLKKQEFYEILLECQNRGKILTKTLDIQTSTGNTVHVDVVAAPKGSLEGAILVLQDKSSHYQILEMGKAFIANASHELKTPITIIRGFAETLHDHPHLSREIVDEITQKIVLNCQRMASLVKNLLTLADIDNLPHSKLKECSLETLFEESIHQLVSVHPKAEVGVEYQVDKHPSIIADGDLLQLAFLNLLDNAVKYSHPPAHISIIVQNEGEWIKIQIIDKGIGIPEEDLTHIFERFYTVDKARSRSLGGAGLGLSIVQTIIEKHSGKITVESTLGKGSTFTIFLPDLNKKR